MGMDVEALERKRKWAAVCGMADLERYLAELQRARQELAELRAGQEAAIDEALRRQAAAAIRRVELSDPLGPELGAVLALVPEEWRLFVGPAPPGVDYGGQIHATWLRRGSYGHEAWAPTREAAILAATRELLGLDDEALRRRIAASPAEVVRAAMALVDAMPACSTMTGETLGPLCQAERQLVDAVERLRGAAEPRQTCGTCARWQRDAEPATDAGARPCGLDTEPEPCPRHPKSGCGRPGRYQPRDEVTAETDPAPSSGGAS